MKRILAAFLLVGGALFAQEEGLLNIRRGPLRVTAGAETGFVWIADHTIQFGEAGSRVDYVAEGGQDTLFPFSRYSLDIGWKRNTFVLLYQPLTLETRTRLRRDILIDDTTFRSNTPVRFLYRFPFYRVSWVFSLIRNQRVEGQAGLSFQIRNAEIAFASEDGLEFKRNHNIGPVPILKTRWRFSLTDSFWLGIEADGFCASSRFFNGADFPFTGAIWDASLRLGYAPRPGVDLFLNLRILGGGAEGTSRYPSDGVMDGYTRNWLNTVALTAGALLR